MTFSVESLPLEGLALVHSHRFADRRGYLEETWSQHAFAQLGIPCAFVQENQSLSHRKYTLRGLHFQKPPHEQAKLVRVLVGRIFDVALDLRRDSPTFRRWHGVTLSAAEEKQIYIPRGFAHGFLSLEDETLVSYKVDAPYAPACEAGIRWNDDQIAIDWQVAPEKVILSERDRSLPDLVDCGLYA